MEDIPDIYHSSGLYRDQVLYTINHLYSLIEIINENVKTVLYLNCGNCMSVLGTIYYMLPATVTRFVLSDPNPEMVAYARRSFIFEKTSFIQLDILDPNLQVPEEFDCVMSASNIRWVHNMGVSLSNLCNLMKPLGVGILMIESYNQYYSTAIRNLAKKERWAGYIGDIVRGISPFEGNRFAVIEIPQKLYQHRMRDIKSKVQTFPYVYNSFGALRDLLYHSYRAGSLVPATEIGDFNDAVQEELENAGCVSVTKFNRLEYKLITQITSFTFLKECEYLT